MSEWITDHDFLENESGWCGTEYTCRVCEASVNVHTKTIDPYWSKRVSLNATIATKDEQIAVLRAALEAVIEHAEGDPSDLCVIVDEIARAALAATAPPVPSDPEAVVIEAPIEPGGKARKWVFEMTCDECDTTMTDLGDGDYKCLICEVDRRDLEAGR